MVARRRKEIEVCTVYPAQGDQNMLLVFARYHQTASVECSLDGSAMRDARIGLLEPTEQQMLREADREGTSVHPMLYGASCRD